MVCTAVIGGAIICWQQATITFVFSPLIIAGTIAGSRLNWGKRGGGKSASDVG